MNRQTIALCLITHNNETTIGFAIKSCLALVDEVIVVDIGSRDNTRLIAEGYGARVIDYVFEDDYAKVKNFALDEISSTWVMWLNPNESVSPTRPHDFQTLLQANVGGYRIEITPEDDRQPITPTETLRLFRSNPKVRYQYPVHELIEHSLCRWRSDIEDTDVIKISQDNQCGLSSPKGSLGVVSILNKSIEDNPHDPYPLYILSCEYIRELEGEVTPTPMLGISIDALSKAVREFYTLDKDDRQKLYYIPDLMTKLSACHLAVGNIGFSWQTIRDARELYPENHSIMLQYLLSGISYLRTFVKNNQSVEAENWERKLLAIVRVLRSLDIEPARVARYEGDLNLFMGNIPEAQLCFELSLSIQNDYSYALLGLAQCQMLSGNEAGAVKFYLEATHRNKHNYLAWLQGSKTLRELGFVDNAKTWHSMVPDNLVPSLEFEASS